MPDNLRSAETSPELGAQTVSQAQLEASYKLEHSYAGQFGHLIEPVIEPLGFDWKIGIGLITSFAAREVMVGTLNTIYSVEDEGGEALSLQKKLQRDVNESTGEPVYNVWTALSLMVFFALAMQCMSTIAIVRRETNSWKWPAIMFTYMTGLAYLCSFIVYQVGMSL
jgi:ferrous iron transport protein B